MVFPKYSIIVPVYNTVENYLRRCIDGIIAQSYTDWELVLVDDGSLEYTRNFIYGYTLRDVRIHVVYSDHQGVSNARNIGLNAAQGEYVMFVDSDDWIEPDYLQTVEAYMGDDADMYIVGITQDFEIEDKQLSYSKVSVIPAHRIVNPDALSSQFGYMYRTINLSSACLKTYRKDFIHRYNISFLKEMIVLEDFYFVLTCFLHSPRLSLIPYIGYHYMLPDDYQPIRRRGAFDLFPSIHLILDQFDKVAETLQFKGYSRKVFLMASRNIMSYVFNQPYIINGLTSSFKRIAKDSFFIKYYKEMSEICGRRYRLLSRLLTLRLYFSAYIVNKYLL